MPPLVSVIIPVRNDAGRLRRCLASVTDNDYLAPLQLVVVDDGSTDGSADAGRAAGALVLSGKGRSVAALRNQGVHEADGEVVVFVDADHEIGKDWIRIAVDILTDSGIGAVGSIYSPPPLPTWVQRQYNSLRHHPIEREEVTWLGSGSLAMKAATFRQVGEFDSSLIACEDVDLCNRLRKAGFRLVADAALHSVHHGDPKTLKALFLGELWRGRGNVLVTMSGPRTLRDLRSLLVPMSNLICVGLAAISLVFGHVLLAFLSGVAALVPSGLRVAVMVKRQRHRGPKVAVQALTVAVVFDLARALALFIPVPHRVRRSE